MSVSAPMHPPGSNVTVRVAESDGTEHVTHTHNTVCEGWHTLLIRLADPEDGLTHNDLDYHLDLGEASGASPAYSDTVVAQQFTRIDVTDFINEGTGLYTSTFVSSTEANPDSSSAYQPINNIGVVAEIDGESTEYLCNHAVITEIQKTQSKTATLESTLTLNDDPDDL